jgi:hypothetical protein
MPQRMLAMCAFALVLFLSSCANKQASSTTPQHATVMMRDGTAVSGKVTASSPTEITIIGDDSITRTIPMAQVKSVDYGEATAPPPAQTAAQAPPPQSQPPARPERESQRRTASRVKEPEPAPAREEHYHPTQSEIQTTTYNLPAGTEVPVRVEESIDSGKAVDGQTYAAQVTKDLVDASGHVVIPRGSNAHIVIKSASRGGRIRGASDLVLDLQSVSVGGQEYRLEAADIQQRGKSGVGANKRTAEYTGGGAAIGAIIGALAGHGKGAAIGAGAGAGAGALAQILTKGRNIRVPAETVLTFKLDEALHVTAAR